MTAERKRSGERRNKVDSREIRLDHVRVLEEAGINPYPAEPPLITHTNQEISSSRFEKLEGAEVGVVGKISAIRSHGRAIFFDIEDHTAEVQIYISKQGEDDKTFDLVASAYDEGDFVGVKGIVFKTKTGEITVRAQELTMLAKAILPPPERRFMAVDSDNVRELARRQRYLELMANPEARERFRMRSRMVQLMREEFMYRGFLEVETPILDTAYGGAHAKPFITQMEALDKETMYLRIANELYLKRLVVGNMGPVFEFSRDFRNESIDRTHNPEFTQVELYEPYSDYNRMMEMAEKIFERIAMDLHGTTQIQYGEHTIDFKAPWKRLTIYDGLRLALGIEPTTISDEELQMAQQRLDADPNTPTKHRGLTRRGDILHALFEIQYDGKIIQPTFILDYPWETSPLTKRHRVDPALVERFECAVGGFEVMNCYTELNDPRDQRARFEEEKRQKELGNIETMPTDEDFITAMEYGMPPMGGIGIAIDRMAMILTNTNHIRDIILFPQTKPTVKQ